MSVDILDSSRSILSAIVAPFPVFPVRRSVEADPFERQWIRRVIELPTGLPDSIRIRFTFVSDGSITEDGYYLDDVRVRGM